MGQTLGLKLVWGACLSIFVCSCAQPEVSLEEKMAVDVTERKPGEEYTLVVGGVG